MRKSGHSAFSFSLFLHFVVFALFCFIYELQFRRYTTYKYGIDVERLFCICVCKAFTFLLRSDNDIGQRHSIKNDME